MWRASSHGRDQIRLLRRARERLDLRPLAIHVNYLVNLASVDAAIRARSISSFRLEYERATAIGAEYLVLHPGSHKGQSLEEGIAAFAQGLRDALAGVHSNGVTVLLENTVGCGAQLGGRVQELRAMCDQAAALADVPVGYCLDTCHLLAAGYDVATAAGLRATVNTVDQILGIENVRLIHANDSKQPLASRVDRHASIGEGHIGKAGFRRILAHPLLRTKPFILETPQKPEGADCRNVEMLKNLCPKSSTTTTRSS